MFKKYEKKFNKFKSDLERYSLSDPIFYYIKSKYYVSKWEFEKSLEAINTSLSLYNEKNPKIEKIILVI